MLFIGEKSGGCGGQKLVNLTQSNFPNCLKALKKQAIKQKKQKGAQEAKNKADLIPGGFPSAP